MNRLFSVVSGVARLNTVAATAPGFGSRAWLATAAAASTKAAAAAPTAAGTGKDAVTGVAEPRKKYKNHFKRASSTMAQLEKDRTIRMQLSREALRGKVPEFEVGDAVEIKYSQTVADAATTIRGIVIAKRSQNLDSSFTLLNSFNDEVVEMTYPYASPLLKGIKLHRKWHLHNGKRRARRSKLYYLKEKPSKEWMVS